MSLHGEPKTKFLLPRALPKRTRLLVESAIERHQAATEALLAFLDEADGDADLEPSLASNGMVHGVPSGHDLEYDPADPPAHEGIDDSELDGSDVTGLEGNEPDLGWPEMVDQSRSLKHCRDDGCSYGGEPSLGSIECIDQRRWAAGGTSINRLDCEDEHDGREPQGDEEPDLL
jgi:hypothetical protein